MSVLTKSWVSTANGNPLNSPNPLQLPSILRPKFHCSPTYSVVTWALFWNSPGISTHEVLYTDVWGFSRRTIVRSRHFRACPCWFIAKFGELQHQRLFFNGRSRKWPKRTIVLLKLCDFWVYNTPPVDIPGEFQKKLVVLCDFSLYYRILFGIIIRSVH